MERAIDRFGEAVIGGDREEHVARLHRDLVFVEVVILQQLDMVEGAFDQRLGAGFAVFFQQVLFQAAGIDPDADRAAIGLRRADDFGDALAAADIAWVDPQAGGALVRRLERTFVMEMDVGDDRHIGRRRDPVEMCGRFRRGAGHADDVRAGILAATNLVDRRADIFGRRVGHGLHGNRGIAADGDIADHDLAGRAALDSAPGTN